MYSLGFLRINYLAKSNRSRPKKNGKIGVYVDYQKLNAAMVTNAFPIPFMDGILDAVAGHEVYSFLDGLVVIIRFGCIRMIKRRRLLL